MSPMRRMLCLLSVLFLLGRNRRRLTGRRPCRHDGGLHALPKGHARYEPEQPAMRRPHRRYWYRGPLRHLRSPRKHLPELPSGLRERSAQRRLRQSAPCTRPSPPHPCRLAGRWPPPQTPDTSEAPPPRRVAPTPGNRRPVVHVEGAGGLNPVLMDFNG